MSKSKAWRHRIFRLPDEHIKNLINAKRKCSHPGCENIPEYRAEYDYITGIMGRVSFAKRYLCETHARKFAEKYNLPWPPEVKQQQPRAAEVFFNAVRQAF